MRDTLVQQGIVPSRGLRHPNVGTRIVGGEAGDIGQLQYIVQLVVWKNLLKMTTIDKRLDTFRIHTVFYVAEVSLLPNEL